MNNFNLELVSFLVSQTTCMVSIMEMRRQIDILPYCCPASYQKLRVLGHIGVSELEICFNLSAGATPCHTPCTTSVPHFAHFLSQGVSLLWEEMEQLKARVLWFLLSRTMKYWGKSGFDPIYNIEIIEWISDKGLL